MKAAMEKVTKIAGHDSLEYDFSKENPWADEKMSDCGMNESVPSLSISVDDVMDDADSDEAFYNEALTLFASLKQAAEDAAHTWDAAHGTDSNDSDEALCGKAMALFEDLKQAVEDAASMWDSAHGAEAAVQNRVSARFDHSEEFIPQWFEKHDRHIRSIVKKFEKTINDPMYTMEDLMQEAYLAVFRAFEKYNPAKTLWYDPSAYFNVVIYKRMQELYRAAHSAKRNLYSEVSLEGFDFEGTDDIETDAKSGRHAANGIVAARDNVEQIVIDRDNVLRALNSPNKKMKPILELAALGYSQCEIAAYFNRSQSGISGILSKIRKELTA